MSMQLSKRNFKHTRTAFMTIPINFLYHIHEVILTLFTQSSCALATVSPSSYTIWLLIQSAVWPKAFIFTGHLLPCHCGHSGTSSVLTNNNQKPAILNSDHLLVLTRVKKSEKNNCGIRVEIKLRACVSDW